MIQGDEKRKAEFAEAYSKGKLEMEDNRTYYCLGYRYSGTLYAKIWESKSDRPDLFDNEELNWCHHIESLKRRMKGQ